MAAATGELARNYSHTLTLISRNKSVTP